MNVDQITGRWKQIKGAVRERWGKLTDDDVDIVAASSTSWLDESRKDMASPASRLKKR